MISEAQRRNNFNSAFRLHALHTARQGVIKVQQTPHGNCVEGALAFGLAWPLLVTEYEFSITFIPLKTELREVRTF